jgi:hypothetical protein
MEYLLFFLLVAIIGVLIYLLRMSLQKIELYEEFIVTRRQAYVRLLARIRELDNREMFEKDDDVGVTFSEIKTEIEEFSKIIQ